MSYPKPCFKIYIPPPDIYTVNTVKSFLIQETTEN